MLGLRERNRQRQREAITWAAHGLFARRGFDGATMAEIARKAGVSRATVFNYFPTKDSLAEAITAEVMAHYQRMLEAALADEKTPTPNLIRALFDQMGEGIEEDRRFFRAFFREVAKFHLGLVGGEGKQARAQNLERVTRILARGQERGELTRQHSAADLAAAYDSMVNGTITRWLYGDASLSLRTRMRRAAEVFLGPVSASARPARPGSLPRLGPERRRRRP